MILLIPLESLQRRDIVELTINNVSVYHVPDINWFQKASFVAIYSKSQFKILKTKRGKNDIIEPIENLPTYINQLVHEF